MMLNNMKTPTLDRCLYEWTHAASEISSTIDFELSLTYAATETTPTVTYTIVRNEDVVMWLRNHLHWKFLAHFVEDAVYPPAVENATCLRLLMSDITDYYRRHMWSIGAFFDEIHAGHNPLETGWANSKTTRTFEGLGFTDTKQRYIAGNAYNSRDRALTFSPATSTRAASITVGNLSKGDNNEWQLKQTSTGSSASSGDTRQGKAYGAITFDSNGKPVANDDVSATNPKTTVSEGTFQSTTSSTEQPLATETIHSGDVATRNAAGSTTEDKQDGASTSDSFEYESLNHEQNGKDITEMESNRGDMDMIERFLEYYRVDFVNLLLDGFLHEYCFMSDTETECDVLWP